MDVTDVFNSIELLLYYPDSETYDPIKNAPWKLNEHVPYDALICTIQLYKNALKKTKNKILYNFIHSVMLLSPFDIDIVIKMLLFSHCVPDITSMLSKVLSNNFKNIDHVRKNTITIVKKLQNLKKQDNKNIEVTCEQIYNVDTNHFEIECLSNQSLIYNIYYTDNTISVNDVINAFVLVIKHMYGDNYIPQNVKTKLKQKLTKNATSVNVITFLKDHGCILTEK